MEERVNYTLVGSFVIILLVALVSIGYWLSSARHSKAHDNYLVYMQEAVAGLNEMAPVKYNGVVVGFVKDIELDKSNPKLVELLLSIEHGTPITQSTVATLLPQGITGMTYVGLKTKKIGAPPLKKTSGIPYPVIPSEPSLLVYFGDALLSATNNLNNISQRFDKLFNEKSINNLTDTINNIAELSNVLVSNKNQIPSVLEKIQATLDSVKNMSAQLNATSSRVNIAMQSASQQALPAAVRMLDNLEQASQHLQQLTTEIQRNPSIVLRGKQLTPGPGEH